MKPIILNKPLKYGETTITNLDLRRPTAGDLRGIRLQGIADMDVNTVLLLLKRVSLTPVAESTLNDLDPSDLVQVSEALSGFFSPSTEISPTTH